MKIKKVTLYPYERKKGKGIILCLTSEEGKKGWGEIAPIKGFSQESFTQSEKEITTFIPILKKKEWESCSLHSKLSPSVEFGIESALLDLLSPLPLLKAPLNALLILGEKQQNLHSFQKIKIKVNHLSIKQAIEEMKALLPFLKKRSLRIDANRKWSLEEALTFAKEIPSSFIDYYEEPLNAFEDYGKFPYNIALDETLREKGLNALYSLPQLKALIIKPSLHGGLSTLAPLVKKGVTKGLDFIFSSSYESELGLSQIAKLAHRLNVDILPMGLNTQKAFGKPFFKNPVVIKKGNLYFPKKWRLEDRFF